jgi:hypothetical protein
MHPPPGYSAPKGMVCHLCCSLYGLKQAPQAWFQCFTSVVIAAGFSASAHDPALFVHMIPRGRILLLLYVDDMMSLSILSLSRPTLVISFLYLILVL